MAGGRSIVVDIDRGGLARPPGEIVCRAVNDLLAEFLMLSEEHLPEQGAPQPGLRALLRSFESHLERFAEVRLALDGFVDGGPGI